MGEIATWSAVKTKVGLGKDSKECPTKAELLALSPTGTGENYVGLEISNASSYGNNETVQLSDIHKVTYKYTFTAKNTLLTFTALGGASTPKAIEITTNKTKYLDGVATSIIQPVDYKKGGMFPSWLSNPGGDNPWQATENTDLSEREHTILFTQEESGKKITVTFTQAAATSTWEYVLQKSNFWSDTVNVFTALGGALVSGTDPAAPMGDSYKQEYRNGHTYGSPVKVPVKVSVDVTWITLKETTISDISTGTLTQTATENKSESSRKGIITFTQDVSGKKFTVNRNQAAGVKTYGNITITPTGDVPDIPASGGVSHTFPYTWTQPWGWNGKTNDGGTLTTGGTETWNASVSGSNLGTTAKARIKLGVRTVTVTCNGKSGTATKDVYQAANAVVKTTQGAWVVSISANPSTLTEMGGTSQISASARAPRTNTWSSGATNAASDATGTPTLSIPTAVTGFSLSGTTLTVAENTTANQRSVVVRATMDTVYKEVTVTQSAYLVEWKYTLTTSTPTLNFDALGATKEGTLTSYREKYINGSLVEGSRENVNATYKSGSANIQSATQTVTSKVAITMKENTTTQARTGTVVYEQVGSGKTVTITCSQAAGTVAIREVLSLVSPFASPVNAVGGSDIATVKSGYYDVVNGKDTTWHNSPPSVSSKSNYIIRVDVVKGSGDVYEIEAHLSENTATTSRTGNIGLTYGSKSLSMSVSQSAASTGWAYTFNIKYPSDKILSTVAKPTGIDTIVIESYKTQLVNGNPTSVREPVTDIKINGLPDWITPTLEHIGDTDLELVIQCTENVTTSLREAKLTFVQNPSSKSDILTVKQAAAIITWAYTFSIAQPSSKILNVPAKTVDPDTIVVNSYRTKVINGTQTSTKEFVEVTIDTPDVNWLEVTKNSNDMTQAELFVTCLENKVSSIRSATVTIRQVGTSNLDQVDINQSAATVSYNYYIGFNSNPDVGGYSMNWEYTQFGSSHGQSIDLKCWRKPVINGIESDTEEAAEYEAIFSGVGIDSFTVTNTPLSYDPTITTVRAYPKSINSSIFDLKGTVQYKIVDYPSKSAYLYLTHKPVATVKKWTFQWYDQVESITIKNVSHDSSAGSISPITIISKCEYLLASNQSQVAYTEYIKPTEDEDTATPVSWGRLVENGQTAQNYYDYAYLVDENKEDYERQATRTFTQPGNPSNKRLYLYVSQDSFKKERVTAEIGNYYSYGDSKLVMMAISWISPDGSDYVDEMTTPGGYLGAHAECGVLGNEINMNVIGKPEFGKPLKIRLGNICRAKETGDSMGEEITPLKISTRSGTDVDYVAEAAFMDNFSQYFETSLNIINPTSGTGGTLQIEISLKSTYNGSMVDMQEWTIRPKDSNDPPIYLIISYGD